MNQPCDPQQQLDAALLDDLSSSKTFDRRLERFAAALVAGADPNATLPAQQGSSLSALHLAAKHQKNHPEFARLLLASGARVEALDRQGRTPLFLACQEGAWEVGALLIGAGAKLDSRDNNGTLLMSVILTRFEGDNLHRLVQAMDSEQLRSASDHFFAMQPTTMPLRLSVRCFSALSMVQARQAALAIEAVALAVEAVLRLAQRQP